MRFPKLFTLFASFAFLHAATLTGTIKFEGKAPQLAVIKMDSDPTCAAQHKTAVVSEALVLGEGNAIANVFVKIKSGLPAKTYAAPSAPVIVTQAGCLYSPHVFGIQAGQEVEFQNPDGTLHNVHGLCQINPEFNLAMPGFKKTVRKKFEKEEGPFTLKCDVHPWMNAWGAVVAHPFFSVTGKDGKFRIKDLPAGEYEVEIWHERLGTQTAKVKVAGDEIKSLNFTMARPGQ